MRIVFIFFVLFFFKANSQVSKTVIFPMNRYLFTVPGDPYPRLDTCVLGQINISEFTNVMDYGAVGNGTTLDDNAIRDAFNAATVGVIFPAGHTYLVSRELDVTLDPTQNMTVWAYGATIKMDALKKYTWISLNYPPGAFGGEVIWLGGTMNGNKDNQSWPGSPLPQQDFVEDHGRWMGTYNAKMSLFKDINLINLVMDGIACSNSEIEIIANCQASNGAVFTYAEVQEQSTYFKCRVTTMTGSAINAFYVMNCTADGGVIGIHYSTPTSAIGSLFNTTAVVRDCILTGQRMNPMHWEDTWNVHIIRTYADGVGGSVRFTNETRVATIIASEFHDRQIRFNQASNQQLAIIDRCTFTNSEPTLEGMLQGLNANQPAILTNSSFTGECDLFQAQIGKYKNCTFTNFGELATTTTVLGTESTFTNGVRPSALFGGGSSYVFNNVYNSVTNTTGYSAPPNDSWRAVFNSYVDVWSNTGYFLGRIESVQP